MAIRVSPRLFKLSLGLILFPLGLFGAAQPGVLNTAHSSVRAVIAVQREVTADWMRQPEVLGTAVTLDSNGATALTVYVDRDARRAAETVRRLPQQFRGVAVQVHLTDRFRAFRQRRGRNRGISHKNAQVRPIQLGTSGSWINDLTDRFCCGGTLGGLVQIGGEQYILSNYHVLEADSVLGRNGVVATTGDAIIQPSLMDAYCSGGIGEGIATLETRNALPNSNVDCAIAKVIPGMVRTDGAILEIGPLSSQTVAASIKQAVKKSGRTTGLTRNVIIGLNATIVVDYEDECGGVTAFTKTFTGQIIVGSRRSSFLAGGDSGALLVEDVPTNPRAIGLLFAGSSSDAIANPIGEVLAFLGATMVGN